MSDELALKLDQVTRRFGGVVAVSDVSLEVPTGSRYGIIGPNGAGKTTLFNIISGELKTSQGRIELFGDDVTGESSTKRVARGVGRTYQVTRTFAGLSVRENIMLALHGLRRSKFSMLRPWRRYPELEREVEEVAERFSLRDRLDLLAADLSHGEVRELEIALAMTLHPRLLLLDEPGAGLSPGERVQLRTMLHELPEDLTLIMIEHDMDLIRDVVDRISVLHLGEKVVEGSTAEVQGDERVREIYLGGDQEPTDDAEAAREQEANLS